MVARFALVSAFVLIGASAVPLATAGADPICPATELSLSSVDVGTTTAARLDTTVLSGGHFSVAYDLVTGAFRFYYCCSLRPTYVIARDAYDVTGVPVGTPVQLTASFAVDDTVFDSGGCGGSGCAGTFAASIEHGAERAEVSHSPALYAGARATYHDLVQLPVTIVAGQAETIGFEMWAKRAVGGSHGASATGTVTFTGLAPGVSVMSCQGFAGGVTPVRRSTWGAVKAIYR